jgi:hypothetical protein
MAQVRIVEKGRWRTPKLATIEENNDNNTNSDSADKMPTEILWRFPWSKNLLLYLGPG